MAQDESDAQFQRGLQAIARDAREGARLIGRAADAGHRDALALQALLVARGVGLPVDWPEAMRLLRRAADAGNQRAAQQEALLGDGFDPEAFVAAPSTQMQFDAPRIGVVRNFLTPAMCAWLVASARADLKPAPINDPRTGETKLDRSRTNSVTALTLFKLDIVAQLAKARIASVLGMPMAHQEVTNLLHYGVGQEFTVHFDFQTPSQPGFATMLEEKGQRVATFLIYLNDEFEGGETDFPLLNWRFRGQTGDALFFWNVDAEGAVETKLAHAGLPPTRGEKWLFSQWVRAKPLALI